MIRKVALALLFCAVVLVSCDTSDEPLNANPDDTELNANVAWLANNAIPINSLDPADHDFDDLQPLKSVIGDRRIVMLGEQSHGDGATFLAKVRLIKFLHQEMDFDVIAFESGLYDCTKAWELDPLTSFDQSIFRIWAGVEEVQPLIAYINDMYEAGNPLELSGFDIQFTGEASRSHFVDDFEEMLNEISSQVLNSPEWNEFRSQLQNLTRSRFIEPLYQIPNDQQQDMFLNTLKFIRQEFQQKVNLIEDKAKADFWLTLLESTVLQAVNRPAFENAGRQGLFSLSRTDLNRRDIGMGNNFVWLAQNKYPDRKIIVWAASSHIFRNLAQEARNQFGFDNETIRMGDIVDEHLGEDVYSIAFTAHDGMARNISSGDDFSLDPTQNADLEWFLNESGMDYSLVDFTTIPEEGQWLRERLFGKPMGHGRFEADWTNLADAMFFTKEMFPSTPID